MIGEGAACVGAFGVRFGVGWVFNKVTGLPSAVGTAVGEAGAAAHLWGKGTNEPAIVPGDPRVAPPDPVEMYIRREYFIDE